MYYFYITGKTFTINKFRMVCTAAFFSLEGKLCVCFKLLHLQVIISNLEIELQLLNNILSSLLISKYINFLY